MNRVGGMKIEKAEHPHDVQIEQLLRNKVLHVSINFLRSYYVMYFYSILFVMCLQTKVLIYVKEIVVTLF